MFTKKDWERLHLAQAQIKAYKRTHHGHEPPNNADFEEFIKATPPEQIAALAAESDHEFYGGVLDELKKSLTKKES